MKRINGMVLIMALVFLLIMTLLVSASLLISQLSYKSALAGQQQLQLSQQALQQHLMGGDNVQPESMQGCPAQYAGWSADSLRCEVLFLTTDVYSESRHFYIGYNSILLKQYLITEEQ